MPEHEAADERVPSPPTVTGRRTGLFATAALAVAGVVGALGFAATRGTWERSGPPIRVASWAPYWQPETALASYQANSELFADVSIVAFSATDATTISTYDGLPDGTIDTYRAATTATGTPLIATIFDDSPSGTMAAILADPASRSAHVQAVVDVVVNGGFDGVDLDYETFAFSDGRDTWATTRPNWIAFLTEVAARLDPIDKQLIVSVPPVYDGEQTDASGYWVYDYAAMGQVVDRIRVMAYDYSFAGGSPGPIAPIEWVRSLVDAITELVPPEKVDLGVPTYGYDWVLTVTGVCPAGQQPETKAMSTVRAARTVAERGITPVWDPVTEERIFDYVDTLTGTDSAGTPVSCTVNRRVHYLDAVAVHRRAWVAHRNDLRGVALWALGNDDPLTWDGLRAARLGQESWNDPITATTAPVEGSDPGATPATAAPAATSTP
ncbi:MAG: glycosyl hydrolase family 18 protein [Actinobacteria bacterium]|nr:glycosyl hydrolase family 18 protein [Actinomycetota bacterium]